MPPLVEPFFLWCLLIRNRALGFERRKSLFAWCLIAPLLLFVSTIAHAQQTTVSSQTIALSNITVIDVVTGATQPAMTVLIRDGRIVSLEPSDKSQLDDAEQFDGLGKFVIPALWDMHVHLSYARMSALPVLVANGVTSVRDLGSDLIEIDSWRAKIDAGVLIGPRIIRAGPMLNGQSYNPYQLTTENPEQARGIVRTLKHTGVDFIKIHRSIPRDVYFAILDEANAQDLSVVGHIPLTLPPEDASDAGQLLEHVETLFEGTFSSGIELPELPDAIRRFRASGLDQLAARFAQNNTPLTPALEAWRFVLEYELELAGSKAQYMARSLREDLSQSPPMTSEQRSHFLPLYDEFRKVVRVLNRAGVKLLAGTDLSIWRVPGFSLHQELANLVDAGLTPLQALQTATLNPAKILGNEAEFGSIEIGKVADLLILDANPLEDIRNTERIVGVVVAGRLLRRDDLDVLLLEGKQMANRN